MPLFAILTLFPEAVEAYAATSLLGQAQADGIVRIEAIDFRDFSRDRHRTVDDRPYGGGPGMVLKPEPIIACVEWLEERHGAFKKIMLCPGGARFDRALAHRLAGEVREPDTAHGGRVLFLCGRYEGFDARIEQLLAPEKISIGDFVLCGGELPALCIAEAVTRLLPGVLGNEHSAERESFEGNGGLDHPQYTRPRVFRGLAVPEILVSGDHGAIDRWRAATAAETTRRERPDLARGPQT